MCSNLAPNHVSASSSHFVGLDPGPIRGGEDGGGQYNATLSHRTSTFLSKWGIEGESPEASVSGGGAEEEGNRGDGGRVPLLSLAAPSPTRWAQLNLPCTFGAVCRGGGCRPEQTLGRTPLILTSHAA